MIKRYIITAVIVLLMKVLTYLLAPLLALFVTKVKGREYLIKPLRLFQTHDAPVDEYYYGGYYIGKWTARFKHNSWFMRVCWLWRNPAYGFAQLFGYDQQGMRITKHRDEEILWDKGHPNKSYWTALNARGKRAFMYQRQIYYYRQWCIEIYLGWKLHRKDHDKRCMLVIRFNPFRRYKREVN